MIVEKIENVTDKLIRKTLKQMDELPPANYQARGSFANQLTALMKFRLSLKDDREKGESIGIEQEI